MSDILKREKADRPNNEGSLRGIEMNERKDEIIKRISDMDHISFWCYNHYDSSIRDYTQVIPADKSVYWSDLEELDNPDLSDLENIYIMHDYTQMGDYGGSLVEKANYEVLTDEYGFIRVFGGYGSISCMISIQSLIDMEEEESDTIFDVLEGLNNYPLIDDDELYKQERDQIEEAWDNWVEYDFKRAIESKYDIDLDDYELIPEQIFRSIFDQTAENISEYWINESGYDMWINVDKVVESLDFNKYFQVILNV